LQMLPRHRVQGGKAAKMRRAVLPLQIDLAAWTGRDRQARATERADPPGPRHGGLVDGVHFHDASNAWGCRAAGCLNGEGALGFPGRPRSGRGECNDRGRRRKCDEETPFGHERSRAGSRPRLPILVRVNENRAEPYGLAFGEARLAEALERGRIVVFDGHLVDVSPDPEDPERMRLTLVRALGPPPGKATPDQREIELICPRDMVFATAQPYNIELAPPDRS
jgi:hypothetical protein